MDLNYYDMKQKQLMLDKQQFESHKYKRTNWHKVEANSYAGSNSQFPDNINALPLGSTYIYGEYSLIPCIPNLYLESARIVLNICVLISLAAHNDSSTEFVGCLYKNFENNIDRPSTVICISATSFSCKTTPINVIITFTVVTNTNNELTNYFSNTWIIVISNSTKNFQDNLH
ncbi:hypothetical protein AGLY_009974 [Aphis glycines]|uniref:Uncharacterized protein n=1 Tax=Aphis glycines TaxID=307491 RepID=A0A6G0TG51_APHGL|nr:hypothetical protein AGLY_009974 [Aphis glycines]